MLNKTLHFKEDACVGGKSSKQKVRALVCANMNGSEKLKLLVKGKSKNPKRFTGIKTLSVDYVSNTKSWITQEIFSNWLKGTDNAIQTDNPIFYKVETDLDRLLVLEIPKCQFF